MKIIACEFRWLSPHVLKHLQCSDGSSTSQMMIFYNMSKNMGAALSACLHPIPMPNSAAIALRACSNNRVSA